jgi:hypothetical protein
MKKFYSIAALAALLLTELPTPTYAVEAGDSFKDTESGVQFQVISVGRQTCKVIKLSGYSAKYTGDIAIPSYVTYDDVEFKVVEIAASAFSSSTCTSISVPETVSVIRESAFGSSRKLETLTLSEGLDTIESRCFYYCSELPSINIPASVRSIGSRPFDSCSKLTNITVSEGSTKFQGHDGMLLTIEGDTILAYGQGLEATSFTAPEGVTTIGAYAMQGNTKLTELTLPDGVVETMDYSFDGCTKLTSINLGNTLEVLGGYTFQKAAISEITLPESLRVIGGNAFMQTTALQSIVIPDRVDSIGSYAIYNNSSLTSVTLGRNLRVMDAQVFGRSDKITEVISLNPVPPTTTKTQFSNTALSQATLKVPAGSAEAYEASTGFSGFSSVVEFDLATSLTLDKETETMPMGETMRLHATMEPETAYQYADWSSSNEDVATVDNLGYVTAVGDGTAVITCSTMDGRSALSTSAMPPVLLSALPTAICKFQPSARP